MTGTDQFNLFRDNRRRARNCSGERRGRNGDSETQFYFNKFARLDMQGFSDAYRENDPNVDAVRIEEAFRQGDRNGDNYLSFDEI
jgi:hypothetical protein